LRARVRTREPHTAKLGKTASLVSR
jgi:hypothetical protein